MLESIGVHEVSGLEGTEISNDKKIEKIKVSAHFIVEMLST